METKNFDELIKQKLAEIEALNRKRKKWKGQKRQI